MPRLICLYLHQPKKIPYVFDNIVFNYIAFYLIWCTIRHYCTYKRSFLFINGLANLYVFVIVASAKLNNVVASKNRKLRFITDSVLIKFTNTL